MNGYANARSRYVDSAVTTASPTTLLIMLYERLLRDLERGEIALREGQRDKAHEQLTHAQDIVAELASTLDVDAWEGGRQLLALYTYLTTSLVEANIRGDADKVVACRELVAPLAEAWQRAAQHAAESAPERALGDLGVA
ncbi:flagellar export chaperone FliS [Demequina sp. NBRC 110054]|uniref:flagellar export chaperone FliS n=1 Tax=Demequina sp. NBRC 110054 TaxID=1570343 RepID=UPI0009FFF987|nr:flagellar export chaperone FliS [Demequina sp. NBRC 110054]